VVVVVRRSVSALVRSEMRETGSNTSKVTGVDAPLDGRDDDDCFFVSDNGGGVDGAPDDGITSKLVNI
jgi:hypothetical protein